MFGYVKPRVPELKVREHELYRAMYCGLCRSMGGSTGQLSRFTLSYDFVFLAAVRLLLTGETPSSERIRCPAHPLSRRNAVSDNSVFRYAAAVSASLFSEKLEDDIADERGARRLLSRLLRPAARHMVRKSGVMATECAHCTGGKNELHSGEARMHSGDHKEAAAEACRHISPLLAELSALEAEGCASIDRCASVFGELTSQLFSTGLEPTAARIAGEIGCGTGRFIYVADACDDAPDDLRRGRFNPILAAYGRDAVYSDRLSPRVSEELYTGAMLDLRRTSAAVELACDYICPETGDSAGKGAESDAGSGAGQAKRGDRDVAAIVRNIIYLGMPNIISSIIKHGESPVQDRRKVY